MKETNSVIKVVDVGEDKSIIGKCNMCQRRILNDPNEFWCDETRQIGGKYFCGGCLLELHPIITDVKESFNKLQVEIEVEYGEYYSIDEATGRLVVTNDS